MGSDWAPCAIPPGGPPVAASPSGITSVTPLARYADVFLAPLEVAMTLRTLPSTSRRAEKRRRGFLVLPRYLLCAYPQLRALWLQQLTAFLILLDTPVVNPRFEYPLQRGLKTRQFCSSATISPHTRPYVPLTRPRDSGGTRLCGGVCLQPTRCCPPPSAWPRSRPLGQPVRRLFLETPLR